MSANISLNYCNIKINEESFFYIIYAQTSYKMYLVMKYFSVFEP